ncbi:FGGY-family carbohydrate kinase [Niabella drilacis]|uniref:Sugar (Pentulose or hexulose) kinase n=1 Tax=Niabella drilacis (strain DSM 25811 / CCM 8410 / CCUG 62505 / LMG 26954 / E90) TaxID=1285928 RepID=A0A1G6JHM8_NIADE|nr:FGGY family carbohydrate kinase [Niabella drilacis]SDC18158.1 Sugar (pentulose or hexulose) kinase [Niabella drilacis]
MRTGMPVTAVFDIGKTNKKLLVFDEYYNVVREQVIRFDEIEDDEGFPCEDLEALGRWVQEQFGLLKKDPGLQLKAVNFSTYGASVVYLDKDGLPVGYLYNYLKPYPAELQNAFEQERGDAAAFSVATCTPLMGHLNAGMQLYWMKKKKQDLLQKVAHVLHFPQYLSYLLTGKMMTEMTHLGCHSGMWDFRKNRYHTWLAEEGLIEMLAPITPGSHAVNVKNEGTGELIAIGAGLHDSSAAVIPYLQRFPDPFMILSTGTWSISLNPFNQTLPNATELSKGSLSYLSDTGLPVKASMLFAGNDHDLQVKRIAAYFNSSPGFYQSVMPDRELFEGLLSGLPAAGISEEVAAITSATTPARFRSRDLQQYRNASEAYHQLVADIVTQQKTSSAMVLGDGGPRQLFVDGGFCKNELYMQLLSAAFPQMKVCAATMVQGTALGAALALHHHWNRKPLAAALVQLMHYSG